MPSSCLSFPAALRLARRHPAGLLLAALTFALTPLPAGAATPQDSAGPASASSTPPPADATNPRLPVKNLQRVVVTGIRGSIEKSLQVKQQSNEIVEVVSAEDIGKLPDPSIADSLSRLSGLATQRGLDGQANQISIRGLSPDFTATLLNGHEQASTGENRGVEFNQYPAELINQVVVYKTPDASLLGQGLAGTVDMHTIKPLDFDGMKLAANLRGQRGSNGSLNPGSGVGDWGNRFSLSWIDQFFDHTLGIALGAAREDAPIQQRQYQAWWWSVDNGTAGIDQNWGGPHTPGMPDNVISQEGMQLRALSQDQVRDGVMGVLEWAPNDTYYSTLNLFYSRFDKRSYKNGLQWSSSPYDNVSYANVGTVPLQPYPLVTSGTLMGIAPILQNGYNRERDYLFSADWSNQIHFGDDWVVSGDVAYSSARVKLLDAYTFTGLPGGALGDVQFTTPRDFGFPDFRTSFNPGDPASLVFTDTDNYSYNGRQEFDRQKDHLKSARLAISHPLGWIFSSVEAGIAWSDREKTKQADVFFAYLNGNGSDPGTYDHAYGVPIDPAVLRGSTSLGYGGIGPIVDYDVLAALERQFYLTQRNGAGDYDRNYTVREKVPVAYLKFNLDTTLGSIPLRGNAGVQVVRTEQSSQAFQTTGDDKVGTLTGGATYTKVLPSLNLVAELGDKQYLRFGFAKTLTRGRIDDEKVASSASVSEVQNGPGAGQVRWSGSGGNPKLRPYIAVGTDLAWEKYFDDATYVGIDVFNKNILNYIYTRTVADYDFSGYTNNNPLLTPSSNIGTFSTPQNGTGGRMQGVELEGALSGARLSPALAGFGVQANFALTNSTIPDSTISNIPGGPKSLPGLSRKTANLQIYYEAHGFALRVAERYRSSFTGEAVALFDQIGYTRIRANKETDLQASYEFPDGRLKGLSLLLQVSNLTNEPFESEQVSGLPNGVEVARPLEYDTWGRTVLLGVNYAL